MSRNLPERHSGGQLAHRHQHPAVHNPGVLDFGASAATPEELWAQLSETAKARVNARAGNVLQWWTSLSADDRPAATVLGTDALVVVEPTLSSDGGFANRIITVPLDPTSFRRVRVQPPRGRQTPRPARSGSGKERPELTPLESHLGTEFTDLLGHLPPRAQELVQDPFLTCPPNTLRHDHYYLRVSPHGRQGLGGTTLRVWLYITDRRSVTFAAGIGHGFREGVGAESWDVTCWRAAVQQATR